jgi:TatD DNase family protein
MIRLFDAHNHLQDERFAGHANRLLDEAQSAGVAAMVVNGSGADDWPTVAALARAHPGVVIPSFGVHPWYVHEQPADWMDRLRDWLDEFPEAGVGEIGLDRWKPGLPWDGQRDLFEAQLRLAAERNRPVSIHCLQAWGPLVESLEQTPRPARGFLLHSYGGSAELLNRLLPLGVYISFPGYFAHERKTRQQEIFRHAPIDRLLIETDAPDQLLPDSLATHQLADSAGRAINHPANLAAVYAFVAQLRGLSVAELAGRVEENFRRLFG